MPGLWQAGNFDAPAAPTQQLWEGLMQGAGNPFAVAQQQPTASPVYTILRGPEYNKWDETLMQRGRIRIPKELDDPQTWLNQDHIKKMLEGTGVDREDQPDGSVILSRKAPTS